MATQTLERTISGAPARKDVLAQTYGVTKVIAGKAVRTTILDGISFSVPRGSLFSIAGPSGSGKSTLLNILTGIDQPTDGRVEFGGKELGAMSENALARWRGKNVGVIFQFFQLLPTLTASENIMLALELGKSMPHRAWKDRAEQCLERVELKEYGNRLPSELSGGQQQRVAIARALANDPPVLVADEPTGNLDSTMAHQVFDLLADLTSQGKTVIYVTHDPSLVQRASHYIQLLDGRIVESSADVQLGSLT